MTPTSETSAASLTKAANVATKGRTRPRRGRRATEKATNAAKPTLKKNSRRARESGSSKVSAILALLRRPGGASAKELLDVTGWQPHSLRGFISGTIRKRMGLTIISVKGEKGDRSYKLEP